jgi:hypothetical protein
VGWSKLFALCQKAGHVIEKEKQTKKNMANLGATNFTLQAN